MLINDEWEWYEALNEADQRIAELEAENKRLREAVTHLPDTWQDFVEEYVAREALNKADTK